MKFKIIEERDTPTPVPVSRYTSDTASASSTTPPLYRIPRRREFGETPVLRVHLYMRTAPRSPRCGMYGFTPISVYRAQCVKAAFAGHL